jgi:hypothetical protein
MVDFANREQQIKFLALIREQTQIEAIIINTQFGDKIADTLREIGGGAPMLVIQGCKGKFEDFLSLIANNQTIRFLSFKNCTLNNDNGIQSIAAMMRSNDHIKTLEIFNCDFRISEFQELAAALKDNHSLHELSLLPPKDMEDDTDNDILKAIAEVLQIHPCLKSLTVHRGEFSSEGMKAFATVIEERRTLKFLFFDRCKIERDAMIFWEKIQDTISKLAHGEIAGKPIVTESSSTTAGKSCSW